MYTEGALEQYPSAPDGSKILSGDNDQFAYNTLRVRIPSIIRDAMKFASKIENCGCIIVSKLTELLECIEMNSIPELETRDVDYLLWKSFVDHFRHENKTLTGIPWLIAECLLYRRIHDICQKASEGLSGGVLDLFSQSHKLNTHLDSTKYSELISTIAQGIHTNDPKMNDTVTRVDLISSFFQISMWGNSLDLSIVRDAESLKTVRGTLPCTKNDLDYMKCFMLIDNAQEAAEYLCANRGRRVDIVLDNSGTELLADLYLVNALLGTGTCSVVALHFKKFQWFVSDSTITDLMQLLSSLSTSELSCYSSLASICYQYIAENRLLILNDPFWTTPCPYTNSFFLSQRVWKEELAKSVMVIFKGDLNYRKLVSDISWEDSTPVWVAFGELGACKNRPAILSLRVCKSPLCAGIDKDIRSRFEALDPKFSLCSGKYAAVTFLPPDVESPR